MLLIASKNAAPTAEHAQHHLYIFSLDPRSSTPFVFEESVGGGHAERGGCVALALEQLEAWPGNWREHLCLAGAPELVALIEASAGNQSEAIAGILAWVAP